MTIPRGSLGGDSVIISKAWEPTAAIRTVLAATRAGGGKSTTAARASRCARPAGGKQSRGRIETAGTRRQACQQKPVGAVGHNFQGGGGGRPMGFEPTTP